jgi:hypothetical protein
MKHLKKFENFNQNKSLILYHGSSSQKLFTQFNDYQFYTVNDYIASNYAYNLGGVIYEVEVSTLNPFKLDSGDMYSNLKDRREQYEFMNNLLKELYDEDTVEYFNQRYFTPSPTSTFNTDWKPIIEYAKKQGYDSLEFIDESFDTYVQDISYIIFDGKKVNIKAVYDITDAVESNFEKEPKKLL